MIASGGVTEAEDPWCGVTLAGSHNGGSLSQPILTKLVGGVGIRTPVQQKGDRAFMRAAARVVQCPHASVPERFDVRPIIQQIGGHVFVPTPS